MKNDISTQRIQKSGSFSPEVLNNLQKDRLIQIAKDSIRSFIEKMQIPDLVIDDQVLNLKAGVFVTLWIRGVLRGCIGHINPDKPLYTVVQEMAIAAATADPRFPPLRQEEICEITIKISILSPLEPISEEEIVLGKHGLLIDDGHNRGILLPEVPIERSWSKQQFLEALCRKADMENCAWQKGAILHGFTTIEMKEESQ
jgi:AmmeMemoRadiSam system protein A